MAKEPTGPHRALVPGFRVRAGAHPITKREIRSRATVKGETHAKMELGKLLQKAVDGRNPEAGVTVAKLLDDAVFARAGSADGNEPYGSA